MDYQELMLPIDFSALFQLVFTLYAAFIAIDYAKSFTALVIKRFYNFQGEIATRIAEIKRMCRDEELLSIESDDYYKSGEGLCLVVEYNKEFKDCKDAASILEKDLKDYVEKNTEYRIFRHFSLFMMFFSFTLLVAGGIYSVYPSQTIPFLLTFIALAFLFALLGWFCAIFRITQTWTEKCSIIVVGCFYFASLVLSFLSLRIPFPWSAETQECLWNVGLLFAVVLPYINFLFFFLLVTFQMNRIRKYCERKYEPLSHQCKGVGDLMGKMLHHQEMKNHIDASKKDLLNNN